MVRARSMNGMMMQSLVIYFYVEQLYVSEHNAEYVSVSQLKFRRNKIPPPSGLKSKPSMKPP
jgi:hypothetical protein